MYCVIFHLRYVYVYEGIHQFCCITKVRAPTDPYNTCVLSNY